MKPMSLMKKTIPIILIFLVLIYPIHALDENGVTEGERLTSIDVELDFQSQLTLPTEGEEVVMKFKMIPDANISSNTRLRVLYLLISPEGKIRTYAHYVMFPKGQYIKENKYFTNDSYTFDSPGVWELKYTIATDFDLKNFNGVSDVNQFWHLNSKRIHILSFYEANSIKISNNSLKVSIFGVVGTFLAFLLGLFGNFLIDRLNNSPKIKVTCSHGFVTYPHRTPLHVFNIEAINYGRVAVTLSGVGFDLRKQPNKEKQILTILKSEVVPFQFPIELMPGKSFTIIKNYKNLWNSAKDKHPTRAFFRDQTGKVYYSKNYKKMFDLKPTNEED